MTDKIHFFWATETKNDIYHKQKPNINFYIQKIIFAEKWTVEVMVQKTSRNVQCFSILTTICNKHSEKKFIFFVK